MILQEDHRFLEFACHVHNYPEGKHFEQDVTELRAIKMFWQQVAGINFSICCYLIQQSVLLELKYVAYLELFLKTLRDAFISERIQFINNVRHTTKLVTSFLEQVLLLDGCRFGSAKVLLKYYHTVTTSNQHERSRQQLKAETIAVPLTMTVYNDDFAEKPEYILLLICLELMDENIDKFVSVDESEYRMSLEHHHSVFVIVDGFLIEQRRIRASYELFVESFPFIYSGIALTVCHLVLKVNRFVYPQNLIMMLGGRNMS